MSTVGECDRSRCARKFFHGQGMMKVSQAQTTVVGRDRYAEQAHVSKFFPNVLQATWKWVVRHGKTELTTGKVLVLSISAALGAISRCANSDTAFLNWRTAAMSLCSHYQWTDAPRPAPRSGPQCRCCKLTRAYDQRRGKKGA